MKFRVAVLAVLALAACGGYPRDTEGTLERARRDGFRVGYVDGGAADPRLARFVAALEAGTGASATTRRGAAEPLLVALEQGRIDLVVGTFDAASPWTRRVSFSRPLFEAAHADGRFEGRAAVRNGEHAWAMAVDRAVARASGGGGA